MNILFPVVVLLSVRRRAHSVTPRASRFPPPLPLSIRNTEASKATLLLLLVARVPRAEPPPPLLSSPPPANSKRANLNTDGQVQKQWGHRRTTRDASKWSNNRRTCVPATVPFFALPSNPPAHGFGPKTSILPRGTPRRLSHGSPNRKR